MGRDGNGRKPEKVEVVMAPGFSRQEGEAALGKSGGDVQKAIELLYEEHAQKLTEEEQKLTEAAKQEAEEVKKRLKGLTPEQKQDEYMKDFLQCAKALAQLEKESEEKKSENGEEDKFIHRLVSYLYDDAEKEAMNVRKAVAQERELIIQLAQPGQWVWQHPTSKTWVPFSQKSSETIEAGFRESLKYSKTISVAFTENGYHGSPAKWTVDIKSPRLDDIFYKCSDMVQFEVRIINLSIF